MHAHAHALYTRDGSYFRLKACLTGHHAPVNGISMTRFMPLLMVSGGGDMSVKGFNKDFHRPAACT
eukprot:scaffold63604_cov20-Tisochrysis_lutea.AAC.2